MNDYEVLREAAAILRRDGWGQGLFHSGGPDGTGRHCVLGALDLAAYSLAGSSAAYECVPDADCSAEWGQADAAIAAAWRVLIAAGLVDPWAPREDPLTVVDILVRWNDDGNRTAGEVMDALERALDRERVPA